MSTHHQAFVPDPAWPTIEELGGELWDEPNKKLSKRDDIRFGEKGSKSIKPSKNLWHDHEAGEGGGYVQLWKMARRGQPLPPRTNGGGNGKVPPWEDIAAVYDYENPDRTLFLQVVRTISGNPRFRQRRKAAGKWSWTVKDLPGHDCVLYRLPGLRAAGDEITVWITEGEKDADRLTNELLIATTGIGGAGKWRAEYAAEFHGKPVVILQDNDQAGRDHATVVARSLIGVAASVKVLLLPGLPPKGDVSDWLDTGNTIEELKRLARDAPEYEAPSPSRDDPEETDDERLQDDDGLITEEL